jgi:hypothetical protein
MTSRDGWQWRHLEYQKRQAIDSMRFPAQCTKCTRIYDLGNVTVIARYTDCSVWKCPGCGITVDDRPPGWGDHHYTELAKTVSVLTKNSPGTP